MNLAMEADMCLIVGAPIILGVMSNINKLQDLINLSSISWKTMAKSFSSSTVCTNWPISMCGVSWKEDSLTSCFHLAVQEDNTVAYILPNIWRNG